MTWKLAGWVVEVAVVSRILSLFLLLSTLAGAQLPPPPDSVIESSNGQGRPFDPEETREAKLLPAIEMPATRSLPEVTSRLRVEDAVMLGLKHQPDVKTALARLEQLEGVTQSQRVGLLPRLRLQSLYNHTSGASPNTAARDPNSQEPLPVAGIRTTSLYLNSLTLSQLIFDFGYTRRLVQQADLRKQAAAAALLQAENDTALRIKEAYYTALRARRLVKVAEGDLHNRQQQLNLARALYQAGNMSPGDVVRSQTTVSNSVFSLNSARRELELARQDLALAMGLGPLTPLEIEEHSEPRLPQIELEYLRTRAFEQRPDLSVARRNVEASQVGLEAAGLANLPSFSYGTGFTFRGTPVGVQYPSFELQLNMAFDLYDGGARAAGMKTARGVLGVDEAQLQRIELLVERQVSGVYAQLLTAERNLESSGAAVASAQEGLRIAHGRYQAALGSLTDVFDAQTALVSAQTNQVNSLVDLDLARARLRHALAAPFEEGFGED